MAAITKPSPLNVYRVFLRNEVDRTVIGLLLAEIRTFVMLHENSVEIKGLRHHFHDRAMDFTARTLTPWRPSYLERSKTVRYDKACFW